MKKLLGSMLVVAVATIAFNSCSDVPEPYDIPDFKKDTTTVVTTDSIGDGTQANPYNVAAVLRIYENGILPESQVYVKGVITSVRTDDFQERYGNLTYYISDGGNGDTYEIYRGYSFNGDKFTSSDQLKVGDTIVVRGTLTLYNTTREMSQGSALVSVNGKTSWSSTDNPSATGLNESFESSQGNFTINNISMDDNLSYVWQWNSSKYMRASAYKNSTNYPSQSRLTSPAFSLEGLTSATLTFDHTGKFFSSNMQNDIKVQASTDGQNWEDLTISAYPTGNDWTFVTATCDLSKYAGQKAVYIGFLYTSTADAAATWEVKNVVVK